MRITTGVLMAIALMASSAQADYTPRLDCKVPIPMSDGVTLTATILRPSESGRFPTILGLTPYSAGSTAGATGTCVGPVPVTTDSSSTASTLGSVTSKSVMDLVKSGYAFVIVDDRGTGNSGGQANFFDERTQKDYGEVLDWIQAQRWSDSSVGTTGCSYNGHSAIFAAEADARRVAEGKPRAIKAVWAEDFSSDIYRDFMAKGGNPLLLIPIAIPGAAFALSSLTPLMTPGPDTPLTLVNHTSVATYWGQMMANFATGGDKVYDGPYWHLRSPGTLASTIRVPVALNSQWFGPFPGAITKMFQELTNAPVKKMWMSGNYHCMNGGWDDQGIGTIDHVIKAWFDHWLKGVPNDVEKLPAVNLYQLGKNTWYHGNSWPLPDTRYTRYYFAAGPSGSATSLNDGGLSTSPPAHGGQDQAPFLPVGGLCSRSFAQWTIGIGSAGGTNPCDKDNRVNELSALTYTSPPMKQATTMTGVPSADLWATLTRPDATFVVTVSDVAPDGTSTGLTAGFLNASHRAIDKKKTWYGPDGLVIRPYHPFTKAAQRPVPTGVPTRFLVEIPAISNVFLPGHRIRISLTSADLPDVLQPLPAMGDMAGGVVDVLRDPSHPSSVVLPIV
jgi:hypothetical protein